MVFFGKKKPFNLCKKIANNCSGVFLTTPLMDVFFCNFPFITKSGFWLTPTHPDVASTDFLDSP